MNSETTNKEPHRWQERFEWITEVAALAIITPALVYGILALNDLPVI